jgi:hypothetical protein
MSEKKLGDLVSPEQFKKLRHFVLLRNESSQTVVSDPKAIQILALDAEGVYLKVPKTSSKKGQGVTLFFLPENEESLSKKVPVEGTIKGSIECVGKISEEETFEDDPQVKLIRVDLTQTDDSTWKLLTDQYSKLDDMLDKMFKEGSVA